MIKVVIPEQELFDESTETFINIKETELELEHSLLSLSEWESKWHKPFLGKEDKTLNEILDYIRCMTIRKDVDDKIYQYLPRSVMEKILDYIEDPMTATWFSKTEKEKSGIPKKETITSEIVYYWMVTLGIPFQCEKWHLNRLITLIRVINIKNGPTKKMNKKDMLSRNAKLNAARRAKHRSRG